MKAKLFYIILIPQIIFSQQYNPVQITNYDFDSRNPKVMVHLMYLILPEPYIFFEGFQDSSNNIYSLKYDAAADSFIQLFQFTNDEFLKKNVLPRTYPDENDNIIKYALWETNEKGNWDIVISYDSGDGWTPYQFLISSTEDEQDAFLNYPAYYDNDIKLIYSKGNSVCLYSESNEDTVFEGSDSVKYSDPTASYSRYNDNILYAVAVKKLNGQEPYLVYRTKTDSIWSEENSVYYQMPAVKPEFGFSDFETTLSFERPGNPTRTFLIKPEYFNTINQPVPLMENPDIATTEFSSMYYIFPVTENSEDYDAWLPYAFNFSVNDSSFIRLGTNDFWHPQRDIYTKVNSANPNVGAIALFGFNDLISYFFWEDSSDGKINLFGLKRIDLIGAVDDEIRSKSFSLSQNYPNPFNPTTIISWQLSAGSWQTIKVFDVLGREVATLVNEYKPAGSYEVEFNPAYINLASGVYYYRINAGSYSDTKKMIYLK
jgi:hypothetical protein